MSIKKGSGRKRRATPELEEISSDGKRVLELLQSEGDLACLLIGASYLDACLGALLKQYLLPGDTSDALLDASRGAIGTYQARADVAYALRLIAKPVLQDLRLIGQIRNQVAHDHLPAGFDAPEVSALVAQLQHNTYLPQLRSLWRLLELAGSPSPRHQFITTIVSLQTQLLFTGLRLKHPVQGT